MVTMWAWRAWLTWLIIAASEVDLPEPVAPVTSTRPDRREQMRSQTWTGMPSFSNSGISLGIERRTAATPPCWKKTLARKRP